MTPGIRPLSHFTPFRAIKLETAETPDAARPGGFLDPSLEGSRTRAFSKPAGPKRWRLLVDRPVKGPALRFRLQRRRRRRRRRPVREKPPATIDEVLLNEAALKVDAPTKVLLRNANLGFRCSYCFFVL
ncbi:hypothetical protein K0M31_005645 [Melipona bicolor]|uniref:Uncharacterized protein n=1 Tax=Melipona bicolor TaxID=60889 RepID=A0AA40FU46_9HYME|nr:hypothetical protein K0M31_005645 [Melipona bicolor]